MTIEVTVLKGSNNFHQGGIFESHTNNIELMIRDCQETPTITAAYLAEEYLADASKSSGVLCVAGSAFKVRGDGAWVNYIPNTEFGEWRVRSVKVMPGNDSNCWRVTATQTNMGLIANTVNTTNQYYGVPSMSVNKVSRTRTVNAWRAQPEGWTERAGTQIDAGSSNGWGALYLNCPEDWQFCNTSQDIGGNPIDINGGQAVQYNVAQEQITIEWIARGSYVDAEGTALGSQKFSDLFWIQNLLNTRNGENWFGFAPGYLLVSDVSIQPLHHEFKRVTMTLLYDKWKHAVQRPFVTKTGVVAFTNSCSSDPPEEGFPIANLTASYVGWLQPFQTIGSFGTNPIDLFPAYVWDDVWLKLYGQNASDAGYTPVAAEGCD